MPADIYQAQAPDAGLAAPPPSDAPTAGFQALQQMANAGDNLAFRMQRARDATIETQASTQLALKAADVFNRQKIAADGDFSTMSERYGQAWNEASGGVLNEAASQLSPEAYARVAHQAAVHGITGQNEVAQSAFLQEKSTNIANWQTAGQAYIDQFVNAKSDAERATAAHQAESQLTTLANGGWISPQDRETQLSQWNVQAQKAYIAKIQQTDPSAAKAMLSDPDNPWTKDIPAGERVAMQNGAQQAVDETGHLKLDVLAKTNPAAAAAAAVRIAPGNTVMANSVFDSGVIWQESRGSSNAVSPAGAAGIAQVMPNTGRQMAKELGMNDVAGMSDAEYTQWSKANPELNKQLGRRYWLQGVDHEGGYLPGAMAFYNAGPGNADRWMKIASDKFGNDPTPAQFMSVVDVKETRDYIASIYAHLGAPTDAYGLSGNGMLRAQSQVLQIANEEDKRFAHVQNQAAGSAWAGEEPMVQYMRDGYPVDPAGWAATKSQLQQAAAAGNAEAGQHLNVMSRAEQVAPFAKTAWQTPPAQVSQAANEFETKLRAGDIPLTQANMDRLDALKRISGQTESLRKSDPITLGERQGLYRPVELPLDQIGTPAFAAALSTRGAQAAQSAAYNGADPTPFKVADVEALRSRWNQAGPADKSAMAATLSANLDPQTYEAGMRQIAGGNRLELTAGLLGGRDPELATKILLGGEMMKDKGVETKIQGVRSAITNTIPPGLYANIQTNSDLAEATAAVYAANKGAQHALIDPNDTAGIKSAMEEVTGPQTTINGRVTPVPKPYSPGAVRHALENLTAEDVKPMGGLQPGLTPEYLGQHAQLMPLRLGSDAYQVLVNGQAVKTADGRNLQVNFGDFVAHQTARMKAAANAAGAERAQEGDADQSLKIVPGL